MNKYIKTQVDFFKLLFDDLQENEFIRIAGFNETDDLKPGFFNNVDDAIDYCNKHKHHFNIYTNLSTTNGKSGEVENLIRRRVLAFDFDKKDLGQDFNHKDIVRIFKENGIYYHAIISSGHGYHVYVLINDSDNINKIIEVNSSLANILKADPFAVKPTQILRVPFTYNLKNCKKEQVNLIWMADESKRKPYNIDALHTKYCTEKDKFIKHIKTSMPHCIGEILKGVTEGHRNFCLGRLIAYFKRNNSSKAQAFEIIKEWNAKCNPPENIKTLEKSFEAYWEKDYKLLGCIVNDPEIQAILSEYCDRYQCNTADKNEQIIIDEKVVELEHKYIELLRKKKDFKMNGNHIAIISILNIYEFGLSTNQIAEQLTSVITGKTCMSKNTLAKVLRELTNKSVIQCIAGQNQNQPNFYSLNKPKCQENEIMVLSFHAIQRYIDGVITPNELRVYCYMRYRLQTNRNLTQKDIAIDLGTTQKEISDCINNLEKARYLTIYKDYYVNPIGVNMYMFLV